MKPFGEVFQCDSITLNTTNNCNLNCIYCFEHNKQPDVMKPETACDIIEASYRPVSKDKKLKFMINFFGGEPMMNWPAIKASIDYCNAKRYMVSYGVTTNLTILTDEMIDYIDDNNIHLLVSADGIKSVHNKNRCGTYDIVMKNLQRLIDAELQIFVEIRMTILPEDIPYALDGVKMFIDMGFDNICPIVVTDVYWSNEDIKRLEKFYYSLMEYYIKLLSTKGHRNYSIKNTDTVLTNVLEPEIHNPYTCPIGSKGWCAFDTNGDVYPCHQLATSTDDIKEKQKLGNIYTGVDETKISEDNRVKAEYITEDCNTCIAKCICAAGCPQENLRQTKNIHTPSKGYCGTQRALVKAVKLYQDKILSSTNIRSRMLNILKANLAIKKYLDKEFKFDKHTSKLEASVKLMHVKEQIEALGEENILPTFKDYFTNKIIEAGAIALTNEKLRGDDNGK